MNKDNNTRYQPPVEKLLTYGEGKLTAPEKWPDYRELGIGPEHIPELIRMATDEELNEAEGESTEVWAPLHAWRALGQLRAVEAVEPLLELFDRQEYDDWVHEELPVVFGLIGSAALPILAAYLADLVNTDSSRISAISGIKEIAQRWPEARDEALAILQERLERFEENEADVNAFLILALVELEAKEAIPLIEQAFAEGCVDPTIMGNWEDVQVELGLKSTPKKVTSTRRDYWGQRLLPPLPLQESSTPLASVQVTHKQRTTQKKAKDKMATVSRKKNRKR